MGGQISDKSEDGACHMKAFRHLRWHSWQQASGCRPFMATVMNEQGNSQRNLTSV